jgi:uncharacterized protein
MLKNIVLKLITFYQKGISPLLGNHCRFFPSCSEYTLISIKKYGLLKGGAKGAMRIIKCGPWSEGGVDLP